jgi:hypothetical protein
MGNCNCIVHYYKTDNEANFANKDNVSDISYKDILSQQTVKQKDDFFSNNLKTTNIEKKIPSFCSLLTIADFQKLIQENILNYIETHRFNYQEYSTIDTNIYKSNPVEFTNGNIYYGSWNIDGEMDGYGLYLIKSKDVLIEGIWRKGSNIYGRIFFPNNDIYEGDIMNSIPHGKGVILFSNGEIYKGDFDKGEMSGKGTFIYVDKSYYSGKIKNGVFDGKGSMKWNNGTEYHGNFCNSILSGKGKMYNNSTGEKYIGFFDKNEFNGEGIYTYQNGDVFQGIFECGARMGKGKYIRNDNVEFDCFWKDDLPNGNGEVIYNDIKIKGFWRNGIIIQQKNESNDKNEIPKEIDLNLIPSKGQLYPNSLPHLALNDVITSKYINETEEM